MNSKQLLEKQIELKKLTEKLILELRSEIEYHKEECEKIQRQILQEKIKEDAAAENLLPIGTEVYIKGTISGYGSKSSGGISEGYEYRVDIEFPNLPVHMYEVSKDAVITRK